MNARGTLLVLEYYMIGANDKLKGAWSMLKGKLQQEYAELTDDDLLYEEGRENELFGRIQQRLGKTKEQVNEIIDRIATTGAGRVE